MALAWLGASCRRAETGAAPLDAGAPDAARRAYSLPKAEEDGWETVDAREAKLSIDRLTAMGRAIDSGEFVKMTSVLVARHGRITYEQYTNGTDATTLLETRSTTKTITGMLVGIAVDRKLL